MNKNNSSSVQDNSSFAAPRSKIDGDGGAIAAHEAGHCIAARMLGIDVVSATAAGMPLTRTRWRGTAPLAIALVDLAGPAAEYAYLRRTGRTVWRADLENARGRAQQIAALRHDEAELNDELARLGAKAVALVERNWKAIERVAAALVTGGTLAQDDVDALIGRET